MAFMLSNMILFAIAVKRVRMNYWKSQKYEELNKALNYGKMKELKQKLEELKNSGGTNREITDSMLMLDCEIRDLGSGALKEAITEAKNKSKVIYMRLLQK